MFTRSHLQEMKRRYASMYAPLIEEKFEEHCGVCGEQGIEEVEVAEAPKGTPKPKVEKGKRGGYQVMVWAPKGKYIPMGRPHKDKKSAEKEANSMDAYGNTKEEVKVVESFELQATMALDDVGIKSKWKKGKLYVAKRDIKKAETALAKSFKRMKKGAEPDLYYEEVELDEKGTAYPATVDTLRKIVKDKQHQTVMFKSGKALVDLFSASAIIAVYDGMKKPELKKKLEDMIKSKEGFMKTQAFAMKMVK